MTTDQFVKARLIQHCYDEGKQGGHQAMLAMAFILRNRVRKGWAGGDWGTIINTLDQHSAFESRPFSRIDLNDQNLRRLLIEIDELYSGVMEDEITDEGLYYYDTLRQDGKNGDRHRWFVEKILQNPKAHPKVAQVGMIFIFR